MIRLVKHSVMVQRDGVLKYPTVGKPFDFTATEVEAFNKQKPCPIEKIVVADEPKVVEAKVVEAAPAKKPVQIADKAA